ncbi:MICAL-like protein 2a [Onychostoma macrolepis]|uniref:MICAL-like protein 2a n=1 Tax=Onychostoma macrolepis TaxID=369639 RepID=UPI00272D61F1|nr:MICAL-like protein 2a [Onychostoma macrolepis]XP_058627843.1 MICAL-like protein 2a [Onychostoma macrolepis]
MAAIKALQQWCKNQCEGYRDVTVSNMSASFRDGLAFCALIHKFRPDLINFESLSKDNVYYNNHLAFRVAEDHLGIPALLDAEDMVALPVPDRLSILTYVSQYYNYFHGRSSIGGVGGIKRHAEDSKEVPSEKKNLPVVAKNHNLKTNTENRPPQTEMPKNIRDDLPPSLNIQKSAPEKHVVATPARQTGTDWQKSPGQKCVPAPITPLGARSPQPHRDAEKKSVLVESSNKTGTLKGDCVVCGNHVHLVQRHLVDGKLYHRSCFKCSVCYGTLKSGAYKLGADAGSLVCTIHQHGQNGFKPTMKPFKSSGFTLADLVAKSDSGDQTSSQRYTSVLSAPIKAAPKPVKLSPALQSWTASAQRTQEARQKFFQSSGPAAEHQPTTRQQSGPSESSTNQNTRLKMEEKDRTSSLTNGKLLEGNTNNNNALNSDPAAQRQLKSSAEVSSWRHALHGRDATGRSSYQAASTSSAIGSSGMNSKESLYLSAISKERSRPPSQLLSTAKAKDVQSCEAPTDWRSKPKAAPNGPRLKSPDDAKNIPLTSGKNESDHCLTAQSAPASSKLNNSCCSINVAPKPRREQQQGTCGKNGPCTSQGSSAPLQPFSPVVLCLGETCGVQGSKPECSLSSCILPSQSCHKPSSPKQPRRGSATSSYDSGNISSTNGLLHETRLPTMKPCYITPDQISKELQDIENKLYDLENEGVELERRLRIYEEEGHGDLLMDPLMVDWFNLIRKKQSYIRRESELMYIARTQDLEEQQPGVEGELRRLINKPEHVKTLDEKKRETELLNRLMKIVNDRNAIVEGLEEDRIREEEEDQQLNEMMQRLGLQKLKNKRKSSFSRLFRRRSKKASMG